MAPKDDPFVQFCDDLLSVVHRVNGKQLGLVARTTLAMMEIDGSNLGRLLTLLNQTCQASIPVEDTEHWVTCQDICESLAKHGGVPTWHER